MGAMTGDTISDRALLQRWVETWRRAGPELEAVKRAETASVDTQEAIRQIFDGFDRLLRGPGAPTSGLIEQQKLFSRLRGAHSNR